MQHNGQTHGAPPPEDVPSSRWRAFIWPGWEERKHMLRVQAWTAVGAGYIVLVPAWLWPVKFETDWRAYAAAQWFFFMVEVFTEHIGWVLLAIAGVAAVRRMRGLAIAATPLAVLTLGPLLVQLVPGAERPIRPPVFRVMSINLLCINRQVDAIIAEIRHADPDVLMVQEYAPHWHDAFQEQLLSAYPHFIGFPQEDAFGAAIYSRLPFRDDPQLVMSMGGGDTPQIRAVLDVGGRHVVFYNVHLLPPRELDYVIGRDGQFAAMLREIQRETLPVVLSGDFNFPRTSPHARALRDAGVLDAYELAGYGRGATWPVNGIMRYLPVPGIAIDHIYVSGPLRCRSIRTGTGSGSDHRPLVATLGWDREPEPMPPVPGGR